MVFKRFFIFIILFSCLHFESNAADVFFNDVYPLKTPGPPYSAAISSPVFDNKLVGTNFKFSNSLNNFAATANGNNVAGTFSYYDEFGNFQTVSGTISERSSNGSDMTSAYFYSSDLQKAYFFVIPGYEGSFGVNSMPNTNSANVVSGLDGIATTVPQIILSPNSLSPFLSCLGTASNDQTFNVSATKLQANLTISAPNGYEVSLSSGSGYTTTLTITPTTGTVSSTAIYTRLKANNTVGAYSNKILVTSTNANTSNITVSGTVNSLPSISITEIDVSGAANNDNIICANASATLTASGGTTFLWSSGATTTSITISTATNTIYTVTGTTSGCSNTASITISVSGINPTISITETDASGNANDNIICGVGNATLEVSGGTTYLWSSGATTSSITISPSTNTTYTVTGTTSGCSNTASKTISVLNLVIGISGNTTDVELVTLTASGGNTYAWSDGSSISSTINTFDASGLYSLTVTDVNGCITSTQLNITVQQFGLSSTGEKILDSTRQLNSFGQIGSLSPIMQNGKKNEYKSSFVRDGLVLNLDAGNLSSYPRTGGLTWNDLSGNNNISFSSAPTYSSSFGGIFTNLSGSNVVSSTLATPFSHSSFTIEWWINPSSATCCNNQISFNGPLWVDFVSHMGSNNQMYIGSTIAVNDRFETASNTVDVGVWQSYTYTFENGYSTASAKLYKNGVLINSSNLFNNNSNTITSIQFGTSSGNSIDGDLGTLKIYNTALSSAEIRRNYNALKSRFGR